MSNEAFWIAAQTKSVVPIAWGEPGTGKTRSIESFAKALGRKCVSISLSQHEPTDIGGYPKPMNEYVAFLKPEFIHKCKDEPSLLFLDELTTCPPATQASALRLLTHGAEELGDTLIITAANPPNCAANGYPLEPPTVNRLYHHEWEMSVDEWANKARTGFPDEKMSSFPILGPNWKDFIPNASALITSYLIHMPSQVQIMPKNSEHNSGPEAAWPSYRSWTNAMHLLGACMSLGMDYEKDNHPYVTKLLSGTIGVASTSKFLEWKRSLGFITWDETKKLIKSNKYNEKHMPNTSDKAMAYLATMIAEATQPSKISDENLTILWKLMVKATQMRHKDVAVALKDMIFDPSEEFSKKNKKWEIPEEAVDIFTKTFDKVYKDN